MNMTVLPKSLATADVVSWAMNHPEMPKYRGAKQSLATKFVTEAYTQMHDHQTGGVTALGSLDFAKRVKAAVWKDTTVWESVVWTLIVNVVWPIVMKLLLALILAVPNSLSKIRVGDFKIA